MESYLTLAVIVLVSSSVHYIMIAQYDKSIHERFKASRKITKELYERIAALEALHGKHNSGMSTTTRGSDVRPTDGNS